MSTKIRKVLPRSLESIEDIWVVRAGGTPLQYARGAGKNRGKIGGGGTPSYIIGQPGILAEMTGVTQPISMKGVTQMMSVTSYLSRGRGLSINEGIAPYPSCLCPGFFARATTERNDFTWRRNNNNNNHNNNSNNNNNNNRSRDSADLLGMYVMKIRPAPAWWE